MISRIEFRSECDPDVAPHCHEKRIQLAVVQPSADMAAATADLHRAMSGTVKQLVDRQAFFRMDVENVTRCAFNVITFSWQFWSRCHIKQIC